MDVLHRFLDMAQQQPNHPAVWGGDGFVRYGELATHVRRIAQSIALKTHPKILIYLPQGSDAYAAMFATLMAGGYYAPVNVDAPITRQRLVIEQFTPDVVVTNSCMLKNGADFGAAKVVNLDHLGTDALSEVRPAHDLAYVMFTSGSTGTPKGVMVGRAGLTHYTDWILESMAVTAHDKWSQFPPISFDLSVLDIYGALCGGATLYPFVDQMDRMMPALTIKKHALTIWNSVPSVIGMMAQAKQLTAENLATVRLATFCGEPLLPQHLQGLFAAKSDLVVHNTYGPTEATVSFTLIKLTEKTFASHCNATVALGEPISGMGLFLYGGPHENEGEIVIAGPQVAKGYWDNPKASAMVFKQVHVEGKNMPAYFTGDWAVREGGDLYFVSRIDSQVKIHGFRVELEDVNAAVRALVGAEVSSVVVDNDIHCFVEQDTGETFDQIELVAQLHERLETYAVPKFFYQVDRLPRNVNDKIDASALVERVQKGADA